MPWTATSTTRVVRKSARVIGSPWRVVTRRLAGAAAQRARTRRQVALKSAVIAGPPAPAARAAESSRTSLTAAEKRSSGR
jgi:hypothetical protein